MKTLGENEKDTTDEPKDEPPVDAPEETEPEPEAVVEAEAAAEAEEDADKPRWTKRALRWAAVAAVAAVVAVAGWEGWLLYQQHQTDVAAEQALDAATKYAVVLTSIDTNALDQNFTEVLDGSTGEFKDMYAKSSTQLRQLLVDNKATAHGVVIDAAVKSATKDKVEVLLFVDQSVSNLAVPDPRIDRSRIKMTMEKVDGRWLASQVELP
ncbi:Mce protein [Mycobacterium neglectum]|uniref:Mce protein n=1 Tax=Mycobacterium neglectum TaxID=242737 RepID=UPI001FE88B24|nr:Mce protein [Mycobacterium neglectum]